MIFNKKESIHKMFEKGVKKKVVLGSEQLHLVPKIKRSLLMTVNCPTGHKNVTNLALCHHTIHWASIHAKIMLSVR